MSARFGSGGLVLPPGAVPNGLAQAANLVKHLALFVDPGRKFHRLAERLHFLPGI